MPGFAACAAAAHVLLAEWVQNCCSTAAAGVKGRCCSWVGDLLCVGRHARGTASEVVCAWAECCFCGLEWKNRGSWGVE